MNSLIIFNVRITPPGWQLLWGVCARLFRSHRKGACLGFPVNSGIGVTGLPFCPVPQGPNRAAHHVLSVVAALAIPGSGPPPVASLCSSRREQPGARRGQGCGPRAKHRSGWRAGRREGSPPGGDRAGRSSALFRKERGSTGRKINVSQNICKIKICKLKKFLMQKIKKAALPSSFLLPLPLFRCLPPRGPRSPADKKGLCNKMARRHRHTQQGKEPRCPRPPPPLLHRGRSQSPDRSPRPQGRGVSLRAGSRQG